MGSHIVIQNIARAEYYKGRTWSGNWTFSLDEVAPCREHILLLQPVQSVCVIGVTLRVGPRVSISSPLHKVSTNSWNVNLKDLDHDEATSDGIIDVRFGEGFDFEVRNDIVVRGQLNRLSTLADAEKKATTVRKDAVLDGTFLVVGGGNSEAYRRYRIKLREEAEKRKKQDKRTAAAKQKNGVINPPSSQYFYTIPRALGEGRFGIASTYLKDAKPCTVYTPLLECEGSWWIGGRSFEVGDTEENSPKGWYTKRVRSGPQDLAVNYRGDEVSHNTIFVDVSAFACSCLVVDCSQVLISWKPVPDPDLTSFVVSYILQVKPRSVESWENTLLFRIPATGEPFEETARIPSLLFGHCQTYDFRSVATVSARGRYKARKFAIGIFFSRDKE